jgi:hypothetical protein
MTSKAKFWLRLIILLLILGLGVYLGYTLGRPSKANSDLSSLIIKDNTKIDSLEKILITKDSLVVSLLDDLSKLKKTSETRIKKVVHLNTSESVKYTNKKIREVDKNNVDSLKFFSSNDSSRVIISASRLKVINGMLENREVLKEELAISDSVIEKQKSELLDKDNLVGSIRARETKEISYYKTENKNLSRQLGKEKLKKNIWKIGTGLSAITIILILL